LQLDEQNKLQLYHIGILYLYKCMRDSYTDIRKPSIGHMYIHSTATGRKKRGGVLNTDVYVQVGGVNDGDVAAAKHEAAHGRELLQALNLQNNLVQDVRTLVSWIDSLLNGFQKHCTSTLRYRFLLDSRKAARTSLPPTMQMCLLRLVLVGALVGAVGGVTAPGRARGRR
jgi:hypothetical protein